jgi:hypothetical protein
MVAVVDFEQGRKELEAFLNGEISATQNLQDKFVQRIHEEVKLRESFMESSYKKTTSEETRENLRDNDQLIFVRKTSPEIIGLGTHQLVIDVGSGLVAKLPYKGDRIKGYWPFLKEAREELVRLGFSTPDIHYLRVCHGSEGIVTSSEVVHDNRRNAFKPIDEEIDVVFTIENWPNAIITTDLREGGKYKVVDYTEEMVQSLVNRTEISDKFNLSYRVLGNLRSWYDETPKIDDRPFFGYEPHLVKTSEEAIKKMFLIQVPTDEREEGKLVIGDIDHIYLFR